MHGRDVVVTMVTGSPAARGHQDALDRWWGRLMQMHGPRSPRETDRDLHWRIKAKTSRSSARSS
jgi:1,2-phenylacetyl-CoA epoxidase catalytic subunit